MITLKNVSFGYIKQPLLLIDVNATFNGEGVFLFGQKGAGKTSFLELLCGMQDLYVGTINVFDGLPKDKTKQITYLPSNVVALKNKTVIQNLQYACDAINKKYDCINLQDEFIKEYGNIKIKKLSAYNKAIFALKRAQIKQAKLLLIDVNLDGFNSQEIEKYSLILNKIISDKNKVSIISINCDDYKKLQNVNKKCEICYIFASKMQKFINFDNFANNLNYMGMAEYLPLNKTSALVKNSVSGYVICLQNKTIKINDKFIKNIEMYFDEVTDTSNIVIYHKIDIDIANLSDEQFNKLVDSGEILLFDSISTCRLI